MLPYQKKRLKALGEIEDLVTLALAKMNRYPGMYLGDLRDVRDIIKIKLKLEQVQRRIVNGRKWSERNERSGIRLTAKEPVIIHSIGP